MSFSKRPGNNTPQCYTKPLDSLKNWNNRFFWVDECVFPTAVEWRTNASKDGMPANGTYSVEAVRALDTHRTPIQKQPKMLLCLVEMDLFSLIRAPNPTKVKTGSRPRPPHELPLLTLTAPRVIEMDEPAAATDSYGGIDANAPPKSLRRDHADLRPSGSSRGGKSLAAMQLCLASNIFMSEEWGVTNGSLLDTPEACQDLVDHAAAPGYFTELHHMPNEEFLRQYNVNLARQVAMG
nr:hypothetical protein [Tanacetum cinerariifolium]